ncbi:hypothetical protein PALB_31460 [Pseudoalteromonas luteoviolacea B = ATCC 29581]|nr:hypothetical protein PALB_31460 [Pseudoalteromonas luteoviolacea B = ATCC 29581]
MKHLFAFFMFAFLVGCAQTPDWDYDKTIQFNNYKTFSFAPNSELDASNEAYQVNGLMEKRLRGAIETNLVKQGFNLAGTDSADVLVKYHVNVDKKIAQETLNTMYHAHWNYWGWGVQSQTTTHEYEVGTVIIDVIDNKAQQLVWRGVKEGRLKKNQTPEQREKTVNETVQAILLNFPPKPTY